MMSLSSSIKSKLKEYDIVNISQRKSLQALNKYLSSSDFHTVYVRYCFNEIVRLVHDYDITLQFDATRITC